MMANFIVANIFKYIYLKLIVLVCVHDNLKFNRVVSSFLPSFLQNYLAKEI
jgi:hypothetical protein